MPAPRVFVNRTLNFRKIQYLGFDMDHTLVRYNSHNFEQLSHKVVLEKLVANRNYPAEIKSFPFDYDRCIRGLVIDRPLGNLLKLNRYSGIRSSSHGTKPIDFASQKKIYKSIYIDLTDTNYLAIDTSFSISLALLFSQLVDFKDANEGKLPTYEVISRDIEDCVDEAHRDGSLKDRVRENLADFIIPDAELVANLERYKKHGKKLFVLTNSYFDYTKLLLDYAINPYLKSHTSWDELFDYTITAAQKPRFFYDKLHFLKVNPNTGWMIPVEDEFKPGVYHGGCATTFTKRLAISGEDILYIGDHIYGDILRLKKDCNWRTGLVLDELQDEIEKLSQTLPWDREIAQLMIEKEPFEMQILDMTTAYKDTKAAIDENKLQEYQRSVTGIDQKISTLIMKRQAKFNPFWGETMRIGNEESFFAYQVERYACIYMSKLSDLLSCSPRTYFRAERKLMAHELAIEHAADARK